jgi:uncharacterized BrkB/YihY/UPF0761 family membrane protein
LPRQQGGIVNPVERGIRAVDAFQQGRRPLAFTFGVIKKFGDDSAGSLAALVAYYGFVSLFPLLLVLITILGLVVTPGTEKAVVHSALAQFPIVGNQLTGPNGIHALKAGSVLGLIIGLLGLVWGSQGITQAAQKAMTTVWNVPGVIRPGFVPRLGRSVEFVAVLLLNVIITTVLAGFATLGGQAWYLRVLAGIITLLVDVGVYILAFRVLTPKSVRTRDLVPGAVVAGLAWAILQYFGTLLVGHQLRHANQIYGYFGSILGLLAFLDLAAQISLYAAELNVVRARRLYPRSIVQPPLTDADLRALTYIAKAEERRPEQRVDVGYPGIINGTTSEAEPDTTAPNQERPAQSRPEREGRA